MEKVAHLSAFWRNVYKDYLDGIPLICEFQVDKEKREYLNILKKMGECNTQGGQYG